MGPRTSRPTVLLIHREQVTAEALGNALGQVRRSRLKQCFSSSQALAWLGRHRPDLVVLDLDLPARSAMDVIEHVALEVAVGDHLPVVVITDDGDPAAIRAALELGAADVVRGPVDLLELQQRVLNHLRVAALVRALLDINRSLLRELGGGGPRRSWRLLALERDRRITR